MHVVIYFKHKHFKESFHIQINPQKINKQLVPKTFIVVKHFSASKMRI